MSHPIYFNSILNEARLIEQLAVASKEFISSLRHIYPEIEEPPMATRLSIEVMQYKDWLIDAVSSGLISIATKTRILQDSYDLSVNDSECCPEKAAFEEIPNIVQVVEGEFKNSIRECCNKIIHATSFDLDFSLDYYGTEYWTGWCVLKGRHFKNQ